MKTLQRLYFYLVSAIALEVMIWGSVSLLRLTADLLPSGEIMANSLAAVIVGGLVFWIHWGKAQREARQNEDARSNWVRAAFLFGMVTITLVPSVYALVRWVGKGEGDLWALPFNLLVAAYLLWVIRDDWARAQERNALETARRWTLYFWWLYGLLMLVQGGGGLLTFLADTVLGYLSGGVRYPITQAILGLLLWGGVDVQLLKPLLQQRPAERTAVVRQGVLFLLEVISGLVALGLATALLRESLGWVLGAFTTTDWLIQLHDSFPGLVLALGVWAYHRQVRRTDETLSAPEDMAWAHALRHHVFLAVAYGMILAGGLRATSLLTQALQGSIFSHTVLSDVLALSLAGLALWLPRQGIASESPPFGRVYRVYLYFFVLIGTLGVMASAVSWLNDFLGLFLAGKIWRETWPYLLRSGLQALIFGGTLKLHLDKLRYARRAEEAQEAVGSAPVRVFLAPGAEVALEALAERGVQVVDSPTEATVVVLAADSLDGGMAAPDAAWRVVLPPETQDGWVWLTGRTRAEALNALPQVLQQIARGKPPIVAKRPAWLLVVYILAGLFVAQWMLGFLVFLLDLLLN